MAHERFGKMEEEIYSHSSMLTNRRMDFMFQEADVWNYNAFCDPTVDNLKHYFSIVRTIYDRVYTLFDEQQNNKLIEIRNAFLNIYLTFDPEKMTPEQQTEAVFTMFFITEYFDQLIHAYLQKKKYFFRVGEKDIKGLEKSIEVMEKGGGIFGKKGLQGLVKGEHKSDGNNSKPIPKNNKKISK